MGNSLLKRQSGYLGARAGGAFGSAAEGLVRDADRKELQSSV